jgi:hypothetical protein
LRSLADGDVNANLACRARDCLLSFRHLDFQPQPLDEALNPSLCRRVMVTEAGGLW